MLMVLFRLRLKIGTEAKNEEDTFNRFEILDELGQQEVIPRLINVDQHVGDSRLETISSTPHANSHVESTIPMVKEGQVEVQMILEPNVVIEQGAEEVSISVRARFLDTDKQGKSSPHLGILQKDGKKGSSEKNVKLG